MKTCVLGQCDREATCTAYDDDDRPIPTCEECLEADPELLTMRPLPPEEDEEDEDDGLCSACGGSGGGAYPMICGACRGSGNAYSPRERRHMRDPYDD